MLGIGNTASFGIDENAFKTRGERRLAEQARHREQRIETAQHLEKVERKDDRLDAHFEREALETLGRPRNLTAVSGAAAPSGEASALKALELRV